MLEKKMEKELNKQINEELFSAYLYQAMAAHFDNNNLPGFAKWMEIQAAEEVHHAKKFYHYILEKGGKVELEAIQKPPMEWESPLEALKAAYKHEVHITQRIYTLLETARELKDYSTEVMLHWFINEQVEEEASADQIVQMLKRVGGEKNGLMMVDREMAKRGSK
ncbi:MAG TPA: ferritin [Thermotogota bacterium]|nr:ferritin [Thermotogota bacterium]HRW91315.1 ferritin [Thermotogota bacterium]